MLRSGRDERSGVLLLLLLLQSLLQSLALPQLVVVRVSLRLRLLILVLELICTFASQFDASRRALQHSTLHDER